MATATEPTPVERPSLTRRAAAAAALITFLGAIAMLAYSLVRHPVQLPLSIVLLGIAVAAAWSALVHRGVLRVLMSLIAIVALLAIIALPDTRSFLVLGTVAVLAILSTTAAKAAIGHDLVPVTEVHQVPPAKHGVLLMNPWSGGGKVGHFELEQKCRDRGVTPILLHKGDDLRQLAEQAVADGADVIGMAGGDGSQALVADVARQHHVPFVCVPAGTRNHFALDLGLDRDDVPAALAAYGNALERRVDLAMLGDRVFVNNASLGVYATVVQSEGYRDAKLTTTTQMLPDLLGPKARRFDLRFALPGGGAARTADVVLISNGVYRLDSLAGFGTRERLDGGVLGVVIVTVDRARDLPALMSAEATRRVHSFRGYREWTAGRFEITSDDDLVDVGVDGEALQLRPPLRFRSLPGALRVRTPVDAPGVAPAAVAPIGPRRTIAALWQVLLGHPAH